MKKSARVAVAGGLLAVGGAIIVTCLLLIPHERNETCRRMERIGRAIHDYADWHDGHLPADVVDADGKPLLGWRVLLLPHLGESALFAQFKLNEPWDGEHNRPLVARMPAVFAAVRGQGTPGVTPFRGFAGTGRSAGLFAAGPKRSLYASVTDCPSNTLLFVEAEEPVVWTQPGTDIDPDPARPLPKFGGTSGDFFCVTANGWVGTVRRDFDETTMRAAITPAGNEAFDWAKLFRK